jgi:hypothetical protein
MNNYWLMVRDQMVKLLLCGFMAWVMLGCSPRAIPDPTYELLIQVRDQTNRAVPGATVTLFASQDDFLANVNPIATMRADNSGQATFLDLPQNTFIYFVSAELLKANNWGANMQILFQDISNYTQIHQVKINEIKFADILSGRGNRRWNQLYTQINGNRVTTCNQRFVVNFGRQMFLTYFVPVGCPGTGAQVSQTGWTPSLDGSSLLIGQPNSQRNQRRMNILELTDNRLRLMEQLTGATIVEEYELIE